MQSSNPRKKCKCSGPIKVADGNGKDSQILHIVEGESVPELDGLTDPTKASQDFLDSVSSAEKAGLDEYRKAKAEGKLERLSRLGAIAYYLREYSTRFKERPLTGCCYVGEGTTLKHFVNGRQVKQLDGLTLEKGRSTKLEYEGEMSSRFPEKCYKPLGFHYFVSYKGSSEDNRPQDEVELSTEVVEYIRSFAIFAPRLVSKGPVMRSTSRPKADAASGNPNTPNGSRPRSIDGRSRARSQTRSERQESKTGRAGSQTQVRGRTAAP